MQINKKNKDSLLSILGSKEEIKIIIKKAKKENIKCLLKITKDSFNEKNNIFPIINSIDINTKLILSISCHQILNFKKLYIH